MSRPEGRRPGEEEGKWTVPGRAGGTLGHYESGDLVADVQAGVEYARNQVESCDPPSWLTPGFVLAQQLRRHPQLADVDAWEAKARIDQVFCGLRPDLESESDRWAALVGEADSAGSESDPVSNFLDCWDRVKHGRSGNVLEIAVELAVRLPLRPPPESVYSVDLQALGSLCWHLFNLKTQAGERDFGLTVRQAAAAIHTLTKRQISPKTAGTWIRLLERDGFLVPVRKAQPGERGTASIYTIGLDRVHQG